MLFDIYVTVDWSAAAVPVRGPDSIWYAVCRRGRAGVRRTELANPRTREEATATLAQRLDRLVRAGARVLVGFDFPFGYPAGTARRLGLPSGLPWRHMWQNLADRLQDAPDNANNRFEVAEALNREMSGEAFPFWGAARGLSRPYLCARGRRPHGPDDVAERRLCERRVRRAQPVWKLAYTGSVGSQALTGIPRVWQLRTDPRLAHTTHIWPFETGLRHDPEPQVVLAEMYPSLVPPLALAGRPKDAGQVAAMAARIAEADATGALASWFGGDPALRGEERRQVEEEEAWILGVADRPLTHGSAPASIPNYVRAPDAIRRKSFEIVHREVAKGGYPEDLWPVVVRLVHASGDPTVARDLAWSPGAAGAGRRALAAGAPVFADCEMVRHGILGSPHGKGRVVTCTLNETGVAARAAAAGTTRSAAAVERWRDRLAGAVVAVGNAPTALFRLLEGLDEGWPKPALVLGFPVGFVGAAESKAALAANAHGVPYIALAGRRGGSALAAAAVNALLAPEDLRA